MSIAEYPSIVVLGDSLAHGAFGPEGYGSKLVEKFQGKVDVLNRGMGGYNSTQLLKYLKETRHNTPLGDVKLFVVHIGTNDSTIYGSQHTKITDFESNLRGIVGVLRMSHPESSIMFLSPTICDPSAFDALQRMVGLPDEFISKRTLENTRLFAAHTISTCLSLSVPCVNLLAPFDEALENGRKMDDLFSDGLHFTTAGSKLVTDAVVKQLAVDYPDLSPATLPDPFPSAMIYGLEDNPEAQRMLDFVSNPEFLKQAAAKVEAAAAMASAA